MRLPSRMWRIMQIVEGVIHRGRSWAEGNRPWLVPSRLRVTCAAGGGSRGQSRGWVFARFHQRCSWLVKNENLSSCLLGKIFSSFFGAWWFNFLNICWLNRDQMWWSFGCVKRTASRKTEQSKSSAMARWKLSHVTIQSRTFEEQLANKPGLKPHLPRV